MPSGTVPHSHKLFTKLDIFLWRFSRTQKKHIYLGDQYSFCLPDLRIVWKYCQNPNQRLLPHKVGHSRQTLVVHGVTPMSTCFTSAMTVTFSVTEPPSTVISQSVRPLGNVISGPFSKDVIEDIFKSDQGNTSQTPCRSCF